MRYTKDMIELKEYCQRDWSDSMANFYYKNGDFVHIETVYRYGKSPANRCYTLAQWNAMVDDINRLKAQEVA